MLALHVLMLTAGSDRPLEEKSLGQILLIFLFGHWSFLRGSRRIEGKLPLEVPVLYCGSLVMSCVY